MAFDGQQWDLPAPDKSLGSDLQLFEGLSDARAASAMAKSAAVFALKAHHQAERDRLYPLTIEDLEPLPCSCDQYCTAHGLPSEAAVCLWCAGPLQSARHAVLNGWRDSPETRWCDVCPFQRAEIDPDVVRLDCYRCGFDVCRTCARSVSRTCQESGCPYLRHRLACDSRKTDAQRFPERQVLIKQQLCELRSLESAQSLDGVASHLQDLDACSMLSARLRCLEQSVKQEHDDACERGLAAANRSFLLEMQPACENRPPLKTRGEKRAFWQMSEKERAKSSQSHSLCVWREGVVRC